MSLEVLAFVNDTLFAAILYALVCLSFVVTAKYLRFPDLTCTGSFVFGGAIAAVSIVKYGLDPITATLLAGVGGALAGSVTAFFYTVLRLDKLLSGILSAFVFYSLNMILLTPTIPYKQQHTLLSVFEEMDSNFTAGGYTWHPYVVILLLLVVIGTKLILDRFLESEAGLALRTLEDEHAGEYALERKGFSPALFKLLGLALGNAIVGIAGALTTYKDGSAYADRGFDLIITGLVAFLVGTQLFDLVRIIVARLFPEKVRDNDKEAEEEKQGDEDAAIHREPTFNRHITTFAILGAVVYFGLITLSQRVHIRPEYTKLLLVGLVALSVAQPASLLRAIARRRKTRAMDQHADVLLAVQNLSYRYPSADAEALKGVSFDVPAGTVKKLSGGNGTGKTTALRLLAGFLDAIHGGGIFFKGRDVTESRDKRLKRIAYVDQDAQRGVVGCLSTEENLALAAICGRPSIWRLALSPATIARVQELIRFANLPSAVLKRRSDQLSGGERQVVNLLSLLSRRTLPEVILLDEPMNNLDVGNADRCRQIIEQLHHDGAAILLVSHTPVPGLHIDDEIDLGKAAKGAAGAVNPVGVGTES